MGMDQLTGERQFESLRTFKRDPNHLGASSFLTQSRIHLPGFDGRGGAWRWHACMPDSMVEEGLVRPLLLPQLHRGAPPGLSLSLSLSPGFELRTFLPFRPGSSSREPSGP